MNNEQERCRAIRWLLNANRHTPLITSLHFIVFENKIEECTFLLYYNYKKSIYNTIFSCIPDNDCVNLIMTYSNFDTPFILRFSKFL